MAAMPNLDEMTVDELSAAREAFALLEGYARHRCHAIRCRVQGEEQYAINNETIMRAIKAKLPEWARW